MLGEKLIGLDYDFNCGLVCGSFFDPQFIFQTEVISESK
jgi:hypothetical protein